MRSGGLDSEYLDQVVAAFGIHRDQVLAHEWVDNGPGWAVVQLATAQEVLDIEPDLSKIPTAMVGAVAPIPRARHTRSNCAASPPVSEWPKTRSAAA